MNPQDIPWQGHLCFGCGSPDTLDLVERQIGSGGNKITMQCSVCKAKGSLSTRERWRGSELPLVELQGLFAMARIPIVGKPIEIPNRYWGKADDDNDPHPWWLVKTARGYVEIGWRKRVLAIDWTDTDVRGIVTKDDVTKDGTMVHAWDMAKAVEYMTALGRLFAAGPSPTPLKEAVVAFLEIGKRDLTNPKYDAYFEELRALVGKS